MMTTRAGTTRVVELTPGGRGAVAVVLVAGPDAVPTVDACFHAASGKPIAEMPPRRILFGRWGSNTGEELVVCRRSDDEVEVQCHGGKAAVRAVVERLIERGCEAMRWQDWICESDADPIRSEARIALAEVPTRRTASVLLDQFNGALATAIQEVLDAVEMGGWSTAASKLDALVARGEFGLHLTTPWHVVLAGEPNVGKSSLMNALVGFQRAIVCDTPGTTRDVVTASSAIGGWPVILADTAGLRDTDDETESEGVTLASAAADAADLVLLVADSPDGFAATQLSGRSMLRVLNKIDLFAEPPAGICDVAVSALTGVGVAELIDAIGAALVPLPPQPGDPVPFTIEHVSTLEQARAAIESRDAAAASNALNSLRGR